MNFLQLVESLRIEVAASGRPITTLQGGLAAETNRLKRWVASAWNDIQLAHTDIKRFDSPEHEPYDPTVIGKPTSFTVHPQTEAVHLTMTPDLAYELFYDYRRTPQVLVADDDTPIMPSRYHELIVGWAMLKYGYHEVASEKLAASKEIVGRL